MTLNFTTSSRNSQVSVSLKFGLAVAVMSCNCSYSATISWVLGLGFHCVESGHKCDLFTVCRDLNSAGLEIYHSGL